MDPPPCQREVAFLLKENGGIEKLNIPLGSDGKALDLGSDEWGPFVEKQLQINRKDVCECLAAEDWATQDPFRQPRTQWDLTFLNTPPNDRTWTTAEAESGGPIRRMVSMYCYPYLGMHHYRDVLSFNNSAPLFSTSEYWRGDMVLVCFNWNVEHCGPHGQIVPPAEIIHSVPAALTDLWCADFKTFQEIQLAFAMLTHGRLGMQACGSVLDYSLVHMILESTVPIRSEDTWDLRGIFNAMIQVEDNSDDDEESDDEEDAWGPLIDSADDADSSDDADDAHAAEG